MRAFEILLHGTCLGDHALQPRRFIGVPTTLRQVQACEIFGGMMPT